MKDNCISEAFLLPVRVCSEPHLRFFQYKVLNFILFTNESLFEIDYKPSPNCSFYQDTKETRNHVLFTGRFSYSFWMDVIANILNNIGSCILKEGMDLVNYVIILGKSYGIVGIRILNRQLVTLREFLKRNTKLKI